MDHSTSLGSALAIYRDILSAEECNAAISTLGKASWWKNEFAIEKTRSTYSETTDFNTTTADTIPEGAALQQLVFDRVQLILSTYYKQYGLGDINGCSRINFHQYSVGEEMRQHWDAIHNLFDGRARGIPVVTVVGLLNSNYSGGEFVMWGNTVIDIPAGAILVFPSTFLYPHQVVPITRGQRFSFVAWAW